MTLTRLWGRRARLTVLLALVLGTLTLTAFAADVEWTYDSGTLTVTGNDFVPDYFKDEDWAVHIDEIQRIVLSEGITGIGQSAFEGCTALTEVQLPETMEYIGAYCFSECPNLAEITLPASVTDIEDGAFYCEDGSGLFKVIFQGTPYYISDYAFETVTAQAYYYEDTGWDESTMLDYSGSLTWLPIRTSGTWSLTEEDDVHWSYADGTLTISGQGMMDGCVPNSPWAFYADEIKSVIIEPGVTSIGLQAFSGFSNLTEVSIADTVTNIASAAFMDCTDLKTLKLPAQLESLSEYTFSNSGIETIQLPENLISIKMGCFENCSALTEITFPASLKTIDSNSFDGCTALNAITFLGDAVTLVPYGDEATRFGENVTATVAIPEDNTTWTEEIKSSYGEGLTWPKESCDEIGHAWNDGEETLAPTCETDGVMTYTCLNDAEHTYTEPIPATGHTEGDLENAADATCSTEGYTGDIYCTECDALLTKGESVPALGHTPGDLTGKLTPTCTQDGYTGDIYCTVCETLITEGKTDPATGHTLVTINQIKPSCVSEGYTGDEVCQFCNEYQVKYGEKLPMTDHSWSNPITVFPTFTRPGFSQSTCTVCGQVKETDIPKLEQTNPFVDVTEDTWYYNSVLWASRTGITTGTDDTHFTPEAVCTRGQVVTFLWRALTEQTKSNGANPFTDVTKTDFFYDAVLWAEKNDITEGTSPTTFSPALPCTRVQVVTFLWRASGCPASGGRASFTDVPTGTWYSDAVTWAKNSGITDGTGNGLFTPDAQCTRAQIVTFLYRWIGTENIA